MKLIVNSLGNWKLFFLAFMLAVGFTFFFSSRQVVHAQSDCIDPATGAACTPVPPPSCGVAGTPPCEPPPPTSPPPPSGCTDAAGNPCTPVPPPSKPDPTNTPRPRPTRTLAPTSTLTATPTTYFIMPKETATPTPLGLATATNQYIYPKATATSLVDIPAPFIPPPKPVTPKSQQGLWGGLASNLVGYWNQWISKLFPDKSTSMVIDDKLWLTKGIAVQGKNNICVGGTECSVPIRANLGETIRVYLLPDGVKPKIVTKVLFGPYEEDFYPTLCPGLTGSGGCTDPVFGARPNPKGTSKFPLDILVNDLLGFDKDETVKDKFGASLTDSYVIHVPMDWISTPGTYQFTAYINYNQKAVKELVYDNNFFTFTIEVGDPTMKNLGILPSPTPTLEPSENPYYFDDTLIAVQNGNCIQGCSLTPGWVIAGQPVEIYLRGIYKPYKVSMPDNTDPVTSAMAACKGLTGQNGCTDQLPVDNPPYLYPNFFYKNPQNGNNQIGPNNPIIVPSGFTRFTIPGNWIPSTGLYAFTFYMNYNQQAAPETDMSDNFKTIYLNASALQQP